MNNFLKNTYKDIPGITIINSGKKGKNIGIFAITHGNEPVGLKIFKYLTDEFKISEKLNYGKLYLVTINIKAYQKYIECGDINKFRFIDDNMNRISNEEFKKGSYEFERLNELKNIFDEIDIVIDIHSVSKGNDLIGISDKKYLINAKKIFDVETILVDNISKTGAVIGEFIRNGKEAYGIECGNHIDDSGFENGKKNILNFLGYYGYIDYQFKSSYQNIFEFIKEIFPKTDNFRYIKDFLGFTEIKNNEVFAIDENIEYKNNLGENMYLGFPVKIPKKGDGAGFLFKIMK